MSIDPLIPGMRSEPVHVSLMDQTCARASYLRVKGHGNAARSAGTGPASSSSCHYPRSSICIKVERASDYECACFALVTCQAATEIVQAGRGRVEVALLCVVR